MVVGMFGFLIKKTFFDMWDNMFRVIILNLAFLIAMALIMLPSLVIAYTACRMISRPGRLKWVASHFSAMARPTR